ncbi:hypothetical protein [Gimesia aquarii]|uniref:RedB protein n=1 Tax=Gimesia aquarii TaxID=2527964 RepID=A0A517WTU8_9PLAN|nr:hypothetical protein [Gimesia aquarii]QDU08689.1 hypothetical protein V202x_20590 [Gimesia aquarii]
MNPLGTSTSNGDDQVIRNHRRKLRWFTLPALTALWLGLVGIGMSAMWKYQTTPGEFTQPPRQWPANSQIERNTNRATLVMFAHPHCPCTRASINELALIMAHCAGKLDARVLFFKPTDFPKNWEQTDLWFSAEDIPDVKVFGDRDGSEAKRFHAKTSGYTLLFDSEGQLLFRGGITGSRGHAGENVGRSAIESILISGASGAGQTFTFGCPLLGKKDTCDKEHQ